MLSMRYPSLLRLAGSLRRWIPLYLGVRPPTMSTIPPALKKLYPPADLVLGAYGRMRARHYDPRNTIVIASSGRGGSTWLAEIISTLPGYVLQWEPLHLNNNPEAVRHGFTWQNYMRPGTDDPSKRAYLDRILRGKDLSTRTLTSLNFSIRRLAQLRGYVVKCVNANGLLYWMLEAFPVPAILMVRHPCAVVASQRAHAWNALRKEDCTIPNFLFEDYPHFADVFERIQAPEEVLAFEWAVQTHIPLNQPHPHPWLLTTYERLVDEGRTEVDRLFAYLGRPVPTDAYRRLDTASATTVENSNVTLGKNPLEGWTTRLTPAQVDRVLRVTHDMGVDFYSEALRPDYERMPLKQPATFSQQKVLL